MKLIQQLLLFLKTFRRSGTTTLLQRIAKREDVWVLVEHHDNLKDFHGKGVVVGGLRQLMGTHPKPILVDNGLLLKILQDAADAERDAQEFHRQIKDYAGKILTTCNHYSQTQ